MRSRTARTCLLLLAATLLAGCAALTKLAYANAALAYANLAPMAAWMVDDYVDLQGVQKDWVRERITRVLQWHRRNELPEYGRFLRHVLEESAEPFTVEEIAGAYAELRGHYHKMVEQLLPDVADFFLQLDASQVAQMEHKFTEDNRKFVAESLKGTPEQRRALRVKKFVDHVEGWVGPIDGEQRNLIEAHYARLPDYVDERLADRRYRQGETLAMIRARPGREAIVRGLRRLLIDTESWRRPEFTRKMRERDQRMFEMLAALSATLTPEQRRHFQGRINRYLRDIDHLTS